VKGSDMMKNNFWINDWAKFRKDEIIKIPNEYIINKDFLKIGKKTDVKSAFTQVNSLFLQIYDDITKKPDEFGMPLHSKEKNRFFSKEWRDSGQVPYRPFILLFNLLTCSDIKGKSINVSINKYKNIKSHSKNTSGIDKKISNQHFLFKKLSEYGFVFKGLKNNKASDNNITISYPDDFTLLSLLKMLADKAYNTNRIEDFLCCHFRLLQDDMHTANFGHEIDNIADRVKTVKEREFVYKMDEVLISKKMFRKPYGGFECHGLAYYDSEKKMNAKAPYSFRIVTRGTDMHSPPEMLLMLRIRNVSNCLEYIKKCPLSVKEIFKYGDKGCEHRSQCNKGVSYEFERKSYRRCACCAPAFIFKPNIKDILHYLKLVELGEKK
jgi:hypothetical protein